MITEERKEQFPALIRTNFKEIVQLGNQKNRAFIPVYKCHAIPSGNPLVIKWIQLDKAPPKALNALLNESHFSFDFPGLPSGVKELSDNETIAVLRNYVEGVPLDVFWKKIPSRKRFETIKQLSNKLVPVMRVLEQKKIVHCDLKPSNILIRGTIEAFEVELIDFGLAIDREKLPERKTLFPLGFAAPELILNQLDLIHTSTDVFSFGILIWRLLTGELPLYHANPSIFTNLQLTHPLPHHSALPRDWYELINKSCSKPHFRSSPNRLPENEVRQHLIDAMKNRFPNFETLNTHLQELPIKQGWLQKLISKGPF